MSRPRNGGAQLRALAALSGGENRELAARDVQPVFDGTIASACESVDISLEQMIEMMRWARESDTRVAQFLNAWDALDPLERQASGAADTVRQRVGFKLIELLRVVAEVTYRIAMYQAQTIAALALPRVVAKTVEVGLTDKGIADRMAFHKATGFLPTPNSSPSIFSVAHNAQANAPAQARIVPVESPENAIRRLSDRFNEARASAVQPAFPKEGKE